MVRLFVGWNTVPKVMVSDFSGFRLGLPTVTVLNWKLQAGLLGSNVGHLMGSRVPFDVTLVACAAYRSVKEGARKPEPPEARKNHQSPGWNWIDPAGFTVLPTFW